MRILRYSIVILLLLLGAGSAANATTSVLCFGDSITGGLETIGWPTVLARLRPDLAVTNAGVSAQLSGNIARFFQALNGSGSPFAYVTILIGVNDAGFANPTGTAAHIATMVQGVIDAGAIPVILTLTPRICPIVGTCAASIPTVDAFTQQVNALLATAHADQADRIFADLRGDVFPDDEAWALASSDGLHPTNYGNQLIARFVADTIP